MKLEKNSIIKRSELDERFYFNSLLNSAFELGTIDEEFISHLQLQCLDLLKVQIEKYNNFESSSIAQEKAKIITDSNIYTISLYLKKFTPDDAIEELKSKSISDIYKQGRKLIDRKINISKVIYRKVLNTKLLTSNETYLSTINGGIRGFFKIYDPDFSSADIKITADYPLYNNLIGVLDGIEFIESYLQSIYYENKFCNMFDISKIEDLLLTYSGDYENLIINIFRIVLITVIGDVLADENFVDLEISDAGLQKIYNKMKGKSRTKIFDIIFKAYAQIKSNLLKRDIELQSYIEKGFSQVQFEIYNGFVTNTLDKVFLK